MKQYIITIIGASLLSAAAGILAPDKWRSYVRLITGLVIISCIISPIASIARSDIFSDFGSFEETQQTEDENLHTRIIGEELKKRVDADIAERMKEEFNLDVTADCTIRINDEGETEGVESVRISGDKLTDMARNRICEVYGLEPKEVRQ